MEDLNIRRCSQIFNGQVLVLEEKVQLLENSDQELFSFRVIYISFFFF